MHFTTGDGYFEDHEHLSVDYTRIAKKVQIKSRLFRLTCSPSSYHYQKCSPCWPLDVWILFELFGTFHKLNLKMSVYGTVMQHMNASVHINIEYLKFTLR